MRLSKIKLAGFKSFVDPTSIGFPSNLIGVVGPNGCGKSNIIDAVRWVMGESSAKHLRGDSMADVIFNGSSARKPVGSASIELIFDNSNGSVGGQFANYAEISVRRAVSRDGTSAYFLNGTRCRRKDITGLFLGTGLGPRSYAIIEQGMISRLIEAKPEELRMFLEEAAGISKYKERRRETENRIRHTRENLERLNDVREEVDKQIRHLQRQARTAERYREMRGEERRLEAELLALKLAALEEQETVSQKSLTERETALQACLAELRKIESAIEKARERHHEEGEALNVVQGRYYRLGAEIARLEQAIQHGKELRQRQQQELEQAEQGLSDLGMHIERDRDLLDELRRALGELGPSLEAARGAEAASAAALKSAEERMQDWQRRWEEFNRQTSDVRESTEVERARIEQVESQLLRLSDRRGRLDQDRQKLRQQLEPAELEEQEQALAEARRREESLHQRMAETRQQLIELREGERDLSARIDQARERLQTVRGRLASQAALQEAALGQRTGAGQWLAAHGLGDRPRLAQQLTVSAGWDRAVETVLGRYLEAVCVDGLESVAGALDSLTGGAISFLENASPPSDREATGDCLAERVEGPPAIRGLLDGVFVAEDLMAALSMRHRLAVGESVITPDGIWIGSNWLRVNRAEDPRSGVLAREQEIRELRAADQQVSATAESAMAEHEEARRRLKSLEETRERLQAEAADAHKAAAALDARVQTLRARIDEARSRLDSTAREAGETAEHIAEAEESLRRSRALLQEGLERLSSAEDQRRGLESQREALQEAMQVARETAAHDRGAAQEIAIRVESRRTSLDSAATSLGRFQDQMARFSARKSELEAQLEAGVEPLVEQERELEQLLGQRVEVDEELGTARRTVQSTEAELRGFNDTRATRDQDVEAARQALEERRLAAREIAVRRQTAAEQFAATGFALDAVRTEMAPEATGETWEQNLEQLRARIERLGPINLASIDELKEQSERKDYLDAQFQDLNEALNTLENAIRRIDRETRTRFKETFDRVNVGLQEVFPRLFGGGHSFLELESDDLLEAGVTVMARPPGKRISTIHLLSGGEKALTAVALVFAIFQLNPAPFCMLDEVDAPLDDANVGRFCDIVRSMSDKVQFIFITHNKTTMEMAHQLTGVTMHEPGVSRLVAVDVDEAARLAAV